MKVYQVLSIVLFCCAVLLPYCTSDVDYANTIYVNPATGEDSTECLTSNSPSSPCANLTWVFQQSRQDSTNYVLSQGTHTLTEDTPQFKDLKHLAFTGNGSLVTCTDTGLAFINVEGMVFHAIAFSGCAALRNSTSKNFAEDTISEFMVGLYFYLCESITMLQVSVSHSPNATGVVIYNTNGTNTFSDSNFTDNSVSGDNIGGGGMYVEFTYCPPGIVTCDMPTSERNENTSFTFSSCEFRNNHAQNNDTHPFMTHVLVYHSNHLTLGRGGGLAIYFGGNAFGNTAKILNCKFISNMAELGGGMLTYFMDSTHSNNLTVSGCEFSGNSCPYSTQVGMEGGGVMLGLYVFSLDGPLPKTAMRNSIVIEHSNFTDNSAIYGGGLELSVALQQAPHSQLASVYLLDNVFQNNSAKIGSAFDFHRFNSVLRGLPAILVVENCSIVNNSVHINRGDNPYQLGIGAVHIEEMSTHFKGRITFRGNTGSALSVVGTTLNFTHCHAFFVRNLGDKGAAITLLGASYLEVSNGTMMVFENNSAVTLGGAIYNTYVSRKNLKSDSNCFIRHTDPLLNPDDWNATFIFTSNTDGRGGHPNSIHSTSILPCLVPGGSGLTNNTNQIFCWKNWHYDHHCDEEVTSDIGNLTFIKDHYINVYSGWTFTLPIDVVDDLEHKIENLPFQVTYNDSNLVNVYRVDNINVRGNTHEPMKITVDSLGNRVWHFDLDINLVPCPAGFMIKNTTELVAPVQCGCSGSYQGAVLCDDISKTVKLLSGMWIGIINDSTTDDVASGEYLVMDCPIQFCKRNGTKYITVTYLNTPDTPVDWDSIICGPANRTGVSCGECILGFGPAVNLQTYQCVNCTDINLAANIATYITATYLPLAVLFAILIIFDIRLTTGPANAFILFCQMVTSTFDLNMNGELFNESASKDGYGIIYSIFNLELVENYISPICLSSSFNVLMVLLLDYAVALFPLVMIIVAIFCLKLNENCCQISKRISIRHRRRLLSLSRFISVFSGGNGRKAASDALLPAFASFLLLSYTKFSATTFHILNVKLPVNQAGKEVGPSRVYHAPQMMYSNPSYQLYFIPAVIVLSTVVVLTPLVLLDYPLKALEWCIVRVRCLKRIYPNDKIHLFLNMFQGCYRPRMRFFAGLYFFFRFVVNVSHVLTVGWLQQLLVQQLATTVVILLLILCQPYEWTFLNYVDILIFINLAVLNSIVFYLYSFTIIYPGGDLPLSFTIIQYFLVLLPLIYMVSYILWRITQPHHPKIKAMFRIVLARQSNYDSDEKLAEDSILDRAEDHNTYKTSDSLGDTFEDKSTPLLSPHADVDSSVSLTEKSCLLSPHPAAATY